MEKVDVPLVKEREKLKVRVATHVTEQGIALLAMEKVASAEINLY